MMRALKLVLISTGGVLSMNAQEASYTNSIGMQFVLIHPGTMQVGVYRPACPSPPEPETTNRANTQDPRARWAAQDYKRCTELVQRDSQSGFTVHITRPFYIGKYEVTQAEWKKVMGNNPSVFQGSKVADDGDRRPVDSVTWDDAQAFIHRLNARESTNVYRLPTEFEWEYAGRAGGRGQVDWTDIRAQAVEGIGFGTRSANAPEPATHEVGSKQPNAWGLYDMLGNVWEWVQDRYNGKLFADPVPAKTGVQHVLKGGGFASDVKNTIYATHAAGPGDGWDVGFRIVRDAR